MPEVKISLGCGERAQPGVVGLDIVDFGWNKVWDATRDPIPFPDSSVDHIEADNFIEHIPRQHWIRLFNECWRVLRPRGKMVVKVPDAAKSIHIAMADPTHVSLWVRGTLRYLTGERPRNADYGIRPWDIIISRDDEKDERVHHFEIRPNK